MRATRTLLTVVTAVPVIAGSIALSTWARWEPHAGAGRNHVFISPDCQSDLRATTAPTASASISANCRDVASHWQGRLGDRFSSVIRGPFVLVGDLDEEELHHWYAHVIHPSVTAMCREYFHVGAPITSPIAVLMFRDETLYRKFARYHSGNRTMSIYGYYMPTSRTMVINLSAGDGTLVHELTHALMDFDYPDAPLWLNEGLASMHEECRIDLQGNEHSIHPIDNWRLPIIQEAIRSGRARTTYELMISNFAGDEEAAAYAQARYLCLFLHQAGLMDVVYRRFRNDDPGEDQAISVLEEILRQANWRGLSDFDQDFRTWVLQRTGTDVLTLSPLQEN